MESFRTKSTLTTFLYQLMRDHLTPGVVEGLVAEDEAARAEGHDEFVLTNGHLAAYADAVAKRLTSE